MRDKKTSQSAVEFIILASFMLLVLLGFFAITGSRLLEAREEGNKRIAQDIADFAYREVEIAKSVNDGYTRTFIMPQSVNGVDYSISIIDNKELTVNYLDKEHLSFLPQKVCGDFFIPQNKIDKEKGIICINSNLDKIQCQNAQDLSLCGQIDEALLPGAKCCCCDRYGLCC